MKDAQDPSSMDDARRPESIPPAPSFPPAQAESKTPLPDARPVAERETLPFGMTPYPPTVQLPPSRRNYVLFAGAGLVAGLALGLLFSQIDSPFASTALIDAVDLCGVAEQSGIELGDEGQSITMDGLGEDSYGYGAEYLDIYCVLAAIDMPDSVDARLGNTRALDGTQTAEWGEFSAFWNYHPDDGMSVTVEVVRAD